MANIQSLFKSEITRLSKKVVMQHFTPLRTASTSQRRDLSQLRKQLDQLERTIKQLERGRRDTAPSAENGSESILRFRANGFRKHRERLGISAEDAGKLIGVSSQAVYNWEHGRATPRKGQLPAIAALREMGKREARRKLDELAAE